MPCRWWGRRRSRCGRSATTAAWTRWRWPAATPRCWWGSGSEDEPVAPARGAAGAAGSRRPGRGGEPSDLDLHRPAAGLADLRAGGRPAGQTALRLVLAQAAALLETRRAGRPAERPGRVALDRLDQLRASEQALRVAFEESVVGMAMISLDPADPGRYLRANDALCRLTGYPREELVTGVVRAVHPPGRPRPDRLGDAPGDGRPAHAVPYREAVAAGRRQQPAGCG